MASGRLLRVLVGGVVGLAAAAGIAWFQLDHAGLLDTEAPGTVTAAPIGGPFRLTAHDGRTVTDEDFRGEFLLVYFGFTYCPDVCPTSLYTISQALDRLGPAAERVRPLFITIDPERDTPELMANYVALFHERMIGLTGSREDINAVAKAYRAYHAKVPGEDGGPYLMDHSTFTYLMGPDGKFLTVFSHGIEIETLAEQLRRYLPQT